MPLLKKKPTANHIEHISVDEKLSSKTGKPVGEYITLFCEGLDNGKMTVELVKILTEMLSNLLSDVKSPKYMVAGLGNKNVTPDSLGVRVAESILATGHFENVPEFDEIGLQRVYVVIPRVMAQTGFESADQIKFITAGIKPDCLIVVDSLACDSFERHIKTIQITDSGLFPGSGAKNIRKKISSEILGCPVIAIGVPTVVTSSKEWSEPLVSYDIDLMLNRFSSVISNAINMALNPKLSYDEFRGLLMIDGINAYEQN